MTWFLQLTSLISLLVSALLGFLIGLERKMRSKEAGIRTHTILCIGSALIMINSMNAFGGESDAGRVAAQIVSGIGFLGAGIIVYKKQEIKGLTTAAGVWATAGVGMACGASLYVLAAGATVILIFFQWLFHFKIFRTKKTFSVNIKFKLVDNANMRVKEIFGVDRFNHLVISRVDGEVYYTATLNTDKELSSTKLNEIIIENPFINSIERCDN